jgi:membrane protease YdiL (CAAX protease family)
VVGLVAAAKIFGTDAVLYGSSGSWSDLWRRPTEVRRHPTVTQVLGCLAIVLPGFLICGRLLSRWVESSLAVWAVGQIVLTTLLFVGLPMISSLWQHVPLRSAFQWRSTSLLAWMSAAVAGLALWPFAYEALMFTLPSDQIRELMEKFSGLEARLESIPFGLRLLTFSIVPAITEELFFRGYLLQGLSRSWGRWPAILVSGVIFGAFHVFTEGLSFERFIPSTLLGFCLGWVCERTESVGPGMLIHTLNNGILLTLAEFSERLKSLGIGIEEQTHLPAAWLIVAGILVLFAWLGFLQTRPRDLPESEPLG